MQTLGISDADVRSESRLKSLFWPSIQNAVDVDYLGTQGYWVCTIVAALSLAFNVLTGNITGGLIVVFVYYVGGIGVREHDRFAATMVFIFYLLDSLLAFFLLPVTGPSVVKVLIIALLMSNLRATWIAATWKPESEEAERPPRMNDTFADKMADQLPMWLWPKIRWPYYIVSSLLLAVACFGSTVMILQRMRH